MMTRWLTIKECLSAPGVPLAEPSDEENPDEGLDESTPTAERAAGVNKIYFGPPGTGKTWSVNVFCDGRRNPKKFPTTFHPRVHLLRIHWLLQARYGL